MSYWNFTPPWGQHGDHGDETPRTPLDALYDAAKKWREAYKQPEMQIDSAMEAYREQLNLDLLHAYSNGHAVIYQRPYETNQEIRALRRAYAIVASAVLRAKDPTWGFAQ